MKYVKDLDSEIDLEAEEGSVIARIQRGESEMFRVVVDQHKERLYGLVCRQVGDREVAEDLTQEIFLRAFKSIRSFSNRSKFSTWLTRIAINHTSSYFSTKRYRQQVKTESLENMERGSTDLNSSSPSEDKEMLEQFRVAVSGLKKEFRDVIVLCSLEGKSYQEVADILAIPTGTVRSRLNKARLLLKDAMQGHLNLGGAI